MAAYSFACGLLFSVGLCVSGMIRPSKVLGFLDVSGDWDPSLLLVMGSGMAVYAIAWRVARARKAPLFGGSFPPPAPRLLDARLVGGAALFGVGWGLGGFCPGPALVSMAAMRSSLVFVAAMAAGMYLHKLLDKRAGLTDEASASDLSDRPPGPGPADVAGARGA